VGLRIEMANSFECGVLAHRKCSETREFLDLRLYVFPTLKLLKRFLEMA
jgi:hypothetical protein